MREAIEFDTLTAAVVQHQLRGSGLPSGLLVRLMLDTATARDTAEASHKGAKVTSKGRGTMGAAINRDLPWGNHTLRSRVRSHALGTTLHIHGTLKRHNGILVHETLEMIVSDALRLRTGPDGRMWAELRQRLPDTIVTGLTATIGRPLSALIAHPAFTEAVDAVVRIVDIDPAVRWGRSHLTLDQDETEGANIVISNGRVLVKP